MFEGLGRLAYRRRRLVLALTGLFVVVAAVWGSGVFTVGKAGGFDNPRSESYRADQRLAPLGKITPDVVAIFRDPHRTVDDPGFAGAVQRALAALPHADAVRATSFYDSHDPRYVSTDRHATYAGIELRAPTTDQQAQTDQYLAVRDALRAHASGLDLSFAGQAAVADNMNTQTRTDIERAEGYTLPIVLVLLVVVFGSVTAASLPLAVGVLAILGGFFLVRTLALVTDVSVFSLNIVTMIGLGLAIDYALFVVSRFREELAAGRDVPAALARTMGTAGRTVAFSGLTVAISLSGLMMFPQMFLRSMGFGGMVAVLMAMLGALTVLPALLAVLGHRVNSLSVRRLVGRRAHAGAPAAAGSGGAWERIARSVMRRPVAYLLVLVAVLVGMGVPFLRATFDIPDERALPTSAPARQATEQFRADFRAPTTQPVQLAVRFQGGAVDRPALGAYVQRVQQVSGVRGAQVTGLRGDVARVTVDYAGSPVSGQARELVNELRDLPPPAHASVRVGGYSAQLVDLLSSLGHRLPWMALFVGLVTLVLLFAAFGSVVLPVKAVLTNVLSLGASFGAMVWIFQDGRFAGFLDYTPTGALNAAMPVLMLSMLFGLSMDYEVFLLSRVREQYLITGDTTNSVATGLQRTGRLITSAALLLMVVIGAFATSGVAFMKLVGVGMVIAILVDATIVRALLVPAAMRLLGRVNWWAPAPLRRLHDRWGFSESDIPTEPASREPAPISG
ncbi:MAG: MMPL family transporter [Mycobacteriales bacterium]